MKKRLLALLLSAIMVISLMPAVFAADKATLDGAGTEADPYLIKNAADLAAFRDAVNAGYSYDNEYIKLTTDINLDNAAWTPIGTGTNPFNGCFDGANHTISNLNIPGSTEYVSGGANDNYKGLFGYMKGGNNAGIKNLNIENVTVTGCLYVGTVLGRSYTGGIIENCHVTGTVKVDAYSYAGGIVGRHEYSSGKNVNGDTMTLYNCSVDAADGSFVRCSYAVSYVGGIVGFLAEGNYVIDGCSVKNLDISGIYGVGGISGIGHYGNKFNDVAVEDSSVVSTGNDPESNRTGNVGLIVGATQGTTSEPTVITGETVTNTTGSVTFTDGTTETVTETNGTSMTGKTPVTNWVAEVNGTKYESLADAIAAANNSTVTILCDIALTEGITVPADKTITLDLNGNTVSMKTGSDSATSLILNKGNLTIEGNGKLSYHYTGTKSDDAFNTIETAPGSVLTINNGTIENLSADCLIAYAVDGLTNGNGGDVVVNINGGKLTSKKIAVRIFANSTTNTGYLNITGGEIFGRVILQNASAKANKAALNITGGDFNTNGYKSDVLYLGGSTGASASFTATISNGNFRGEILSSSNDNFISGGTFKVAPADDDLVEGYALEESTDENGDPVYGIIIDPEQTVFAAAVNGVGYETLEEAIAAANAGDTVTLLSDITIDALIKIEKNITLDLGSKKVTSTAKKAFEIYSDATIQNGTIEAVNRCVDTRKAVALTLSNLTLIADNYTSAYGNPQPLTVGGYENGTEITMDKVNISADDGYCIITFVETDLTATNSNFEGYNVLYVKPGSEGSVFNFIGSTLTGDLSDNDVEGNSFSVIAIRADDVTVNVDETSTINAIGNYIHAISDGGNAAGEETTTGVEVTIKGTINGNVVGSTESTGNTIIVPEEYTEELIGDGIVAVIKNGNTVKVFFSIQAAITAANAGDTIQLMPGTFDEYVAPWASDTTHASEKSITIIGAENFGTTLTGGMYLGYDDSGCRDHNITIKGIAFEGKGILVAGQKNVTIEGNKFTNITSNVASASSASKNAISVIGKNINATIKDNIIDNVADVGIDLRNILTATVEGNTVSNTNHNSITISAISADGTINVINNVLSNWGLGGEGRAMRISGAAESVVIAENAMICENAPEEFIKVTEAESASASENYWNGEAPDSIGVTVDNYYIDYSIDANGDVVLSNIILIGANGENLYPVIFNSEYDSTFEVKTADGAIVSPIDGAYYLANGEYTVTASALGYWPKTVRFYVTGAAKTVTIFLDPVIIAPVIKPEIPEKPEVIDPVVKNPFTDVSKNDYFYDAVLWAIENEITSGTTATTFSPNAVCTRAHAVTFLWNAAGKPEPTSTSLTFTDVSADAYYYKAVLWAVENGIIYGTSETTFAPDAECTRSQIVTMLWRNAGCPVSKVTTDNFNDVAENNYYYLAVLWAVENEITIGTTTTTFSPDADCTRGQIVTFMYRELADK